MKTKSSVNGMPMKEGLHPLTEKERERCLKIVRPYTYITDEKIKRTIHVIMSAIKEGVEL